MGLNALGSGQLAAVVTHLEMTSAPSRRPIPDSRLRLVRWKAPECAKYRALFARVGAPWLWFSRLVMADASLERIICDSAVEIYAVVDAAGIEVGMLELDFRHLPDCEIAYFALVPEMAGAGHGRWLMAQTMALAWRAGVSRVWVHTCTLDHPSALGFYQRQGFVATKREIESFPDPRLIGVLPRDAAPQIPVISA